MQTLKAPETTSQKLTKTELLTMFEKMLGRIDLLPGKEKAFVSLFLSSQQFRTLAKAAGVNEATIARRLKKIAERISNDMFIAALTQNKMKSIKTKILKDYFIYNIPMRQIALKNNLTYYEVRKTVGKMAGRLHLATNML